MRQDVSYSRVTASGTTGLKSLSAILVSATLAATVNVRDGGSGGTIICRILCPANDTKYVNLPGIWFPTTGGNDLYVDITGTAEVTIFGR